MSLQAGSSIGTYEIVAAIGKGGMGEVYRARDTRLKRDVAIKSLPEVFAGDADRLMRFQREAEALAALNHPNIAAIYGLEESNAGRFLVLELVEGDTLEERLRRGALPVDEAMRFGLQIAGALEAAHEKGVVHRDLKPANIKITLDGDIKVLDFGLAKALEPSSGASGLPAGEGLSNSPTMVTAASSAGMILGTAAYMSPEQAKGRAVDKRSDIFSFGCVLYEMLTGRQAFAGEDVADILSRVLQRDPDWTMLPSSTSPQILKLLRLCLEKDARKRRRDMGDVRIDIEQALKEPSAERTHRSRLAWAVAIAMTLVTFAVSFVSIYFRTTSSEAPEMRVDIVTPATSDPISFAISPDGRRLAFVASSEGQFRLWVRPLDGVTAQVLAGTEGATQPFWSPDNRSIGFFAGGKLKRVDLGGGLPQTLANAALPRGGAWSPTGAILFAPAGAGPLAEVSSSGGETRVVTKLDSGQRNHRFPQFLPDGRQFLFFVTGSSDARGIYIGSLDSPQTKRLMPAETAGEYLPPGWLLFVRQGTLVARRFDAARGELAGEPVTLASPVGSDLSVLAMGAVSVSASGVVAYRSAVGDRRQLTWYDRSGKLLSIAGEPDENELSDPELSPDGRRIAVDRTVENNGNIWILDGRRRSRFTFSGLFDTLPIWSPDGTQIVFRSTNPQGLQDLYQKPSSGAGGEELLLKSLQSKGPLDWSPDGRSLLFYSNDPKTNSDLWVLPLDGDRKPFVFLNAMFDERPAKFSPDGRWIAYQSPESGQYEIYIRPFPGPGGQLQASASGGTQPRWRRDGKELYYIAPDGKLMAVPIAANNNTIEPGAPIALFQTRIATLAITYRQQYDVAADGRFLINETTEDAVTSPITLLLNWKPQTK